MHLSVDASACTSIDPSFFVTWSSLNLTHHPDLSSAPSVSLLSSPLANRLTYDYMCIRDIHVYVRTRESANLEALYGAYPPPGREFEGGKTTQEERLCGITLLEQ